MENSWLENTVVGKESSKVTVKKGVLIQSDAVAGIALPQRIGTWPWSAHLRHGSGSPFSSPPGSQISCFSPTNFTGKQSAYVDTACWDSLLHHGLDAEGHAVTKSLWVLKVTGHAHLWVPSGHTWVLQQR